MLSSPVSSAWSQTQPLPKMVMPLASNSALKASRVPHCVSICAARLPVGAGNDGFAANWVKYRLWLRIWPALLKMAGLPVEAGNDDLTISSRGKSSRPLPGSSLFRLST